jgi:hypothetical protein
MFLSSSLSASSPGIANSLSISSKSAIAIIIILSAALKNSLARFRDLGAWSLEACKLNSFFSQFGTLPAKLSVV